MGVGSRIRRVRAHARRSQRSVASGAGMAAAYLSRLENDRITPTTRTLARLAESLNVPVAAFFEDGEPLESGDRCPVSISGRCILDHVHSGQGIKRTSGIERYSSKQLEAQRICNFLLHSGSAEVCETVITILKSLLAFHEMERSR